MMQLLKLLPGLRPVSFIGRGLGAPSKDVSLSEEQAHWLMGTLAGYFRLALQRSAVEHAFSREPRWPAVKALLEEARLSLAPATLSTTPSQDTLAAGPVILWAPEGTLCLVLRLEASGYRVLKEGAKQPELVSALPPAQASFQVKRAAEVEGRTEAFGWKWFSREFFADRAVIRDVLIASLFIQLVALAFPLATQAIVDKVITNQATSTLTVLGIGLLMMAVFSATLSWLRQHFTLRLANELDRRLSQRVLTHLFRLPIQFFEKRATGNIINRVHVIEPIRDFIAGAFILGAIDLPFMVIFLAFMVSYSPMLSGVVAAFLVVMLTVSFLVGPRLREHALRNFQLGAKVQGFLTEQVAATETVKSLQLERSVGRRFAELNQAHLESSLQLKELSNRYGTFMSLMEQVLNGTVLCLGAYYAMKGDALTIGMLVAFQQFAQRVVQPLLKVSGMWQQYQQIRISVGQLGDIMNTPTEAYRPMASSLGVVSGHLRVEGLAFRYGPQAPLLYENLSFEVKPGELVLVTGPSGCGKSTLTKIIQGLYQQTAGTIRLDGRDIRSMPVNELRSHLGVVPQESVLFSGAILENLLEASPSASFAHVVEACRLAGIHAEVESMAEGYQTVIGERGTGLSGGQRQRLAIARALLKKPKVLIFDESTSGLDAASAKTVVDTVNNLSKSVACVVIAHSGASHFNATQTIRLENPR